ncbi:hypothetical protein, partial [Mycolicibacterium houstonense]
QGIDPETGMSDAGDLHKRPFVELREGEVSLAGIGRRAEAEQVSAAAAAGAGAGAHRCAS